MTDHEPADDEGASQREQTIGDEKSIRDRVPSRVSKRAKNGTLALLAGGVMLGRAARAISWSRGRAAARGVVGAGLVVLGMRQRRSTGSSEEPDYEYSAGETTESKAPGQPDVTYTDEIDEDRPKPDLDADVGDPRRSTDDGVEINISESELGDEPGGDVGPGTGPATEESVDDLGIDDEGMEDADAAEDAESEDDEMSDVGMDDDEDEMGGVGMDDDEDEMSDVGMDDETDDEDQ